MRVDDQIMISYGTYVGGFPPGFDWFQSAHVTYIINYDVHTYVGRPEMIFLHVLLFYSNNSKIRF